MRQTRKENFLLGKLVYVVMGILVIVLLVLIMGTIFGQSDKKSKSKNTMIESGNSLDIGEVKNALKKDTIPALTELVQQYFTAMSASDISTLEQIVSPVTDEDKDIIRRKKDYIESYNNVVVYSKLCPTDGSYLVFAEHDIKFKNEDTMVPGLETLYVKTSKSGSLYIYKGDDVEAEVRNFINEQLASSTVQTLFDDVNNRYVDALASSATLLEFVEGFEGNTELVEKAKAKAASSSAVEANASPTPKPEETKQPEETTAPTEAPAQEPAPPENPQPADTNETVLITANVNLRNGNDESAERITTMIVGDQATRVSITDNGWSKVQYNGMEGYVKSDYVTTFKIMGDTVKPTTTINVRLEASETANMAGQVTPDTTLTRYAECDNGWSQVQYNGGVGYVKSEYLTK
ncbi:MAG: SH3 domain-containing protein [Lachnospiraceae bacterium]|nr:SH3 domain-containing protein [Lachnospiraceae bacterium]